MPFATLSRSRRIGLLCLLVTAVGWGLNWPVMKLLLREWPPLAARGTAGIAAAPGPEAGRLPGVALALGSAVLFALGTVLLRRPLGLPPLATTAWQVGLGCVPLLAASLLAERPDPHALTATGWAAMAYMTVVPMGVC